MPVDAVALAEYRARRWIKYQKKDAARRKRKGICRSCAARTGVNPRTGRPYLRCQKHRAAIAAATKRYRKALYDFRTSNGLCRDCGAPAKPKPSGGFFTRCFDHMLKESQYDQHATRAKAARAASGGEQVRRLRRPA